MGYELAIGDRSYSSWSLRGWLSFTRFGIPVTLRAAALYTPAFLQMTAEYGARTVPVLVVEEGGARWVVRDSLAIAETLAERHPEAGLWPGAPAVRGLARSLVAEMHAGFAALRTACPMNLRRAYVGFRPTPEVLGDLARIEALWAEARASHDGAEPWLFGRYCLADVFFAPVAARITTYGLPVAPAAAAYVAAQLAEPAFRAWRTAGLADPVVQAGYDLDLPERAWPGPAPR